VPGRDTKERILDVAEALFAGNGYSGTSLRAVTAAAEVNLAAVNYHFGSKRALLAAVFERLSGPANRERLVRLDRLEAESANPALEEVLDAFLTPALRVVVDLGDRGHVATRFLGRIAADPAGDVQEMIAEEFRVVTERFLAALARALPEIEEGVLLWRFKLMVGVLIYIQADEDWKSELPSRPEPHDIDALRARTITFLAAGLRAP
jgi:AcrR family transcriptional regulator